MYRLFLLIIFFILASFPHIYPQETGHASYYSRKLEGHRTSDKGRYHADSLTCAHRTLPFGTYLKVRNLNNNKQVIVKVTDRGPRPRRLIVDVSYRAAKILDITRSGTAPVEVTALDSASLLTAIKDTAINMALDSFRIDTLSMVPLLKLKPERHQRVSHRKHLHSTRKHKHARHSRSKRH